MTTPANPVSTTQVAGVLGEKTYDISIGDADNNGVIGCQGTPDGKPHPVCGADYFVINNKRFQVGDKRLTKLVAKIGAKVPSWGMTAETIASRLRAGFSIHKKLDQLTLSDDVLGRHANTLADAFHIFFERTHELVLTTAAISGFTPEEFNQVSDSLRHDVIMTLSALAFSTVKDGPTQQAIRDVAIRTLAKLATGQDYVPGTEYKDFLGRASLLFAQAQQLEQLYNQCEKSLKEWEQKYNGETYRNNKGYQNNNGYSSEQLPSDKFKGSSCAGGCDWSVL